MNKDIVTVTEDIRRAAAELREAVIDIYDAAKNKAQAECDYRVELAREIMKLREKGLPATLIHDLARGNVANFKYKRDLADVTYRATLEALESQRSQLSALQSALKYME